jgi:hypothetical protein
VTMDGSTPFPSAVSTSINYSAHLRHSIALSLSSLLSAIIAVSFSSFRRFIISSLSLISSLSSSLSIGSVIGLVCGLGLLVFGLSLSPASKGSLTGETASELQCYSLGVKLSASDASLSVMISELSAELGDF